MLVFRIFTGIYKHYMLVFTMHAGIYDTCWYLRCILVFAIHAGIYDACWYLSAYWYLCSAALVHSDRNVTLGTNFTIPQCTYLSMICHQIACYDVRFSQ